MVGKMGDRTNGRRRGLSGAVLLGGIVLHGNCWFAVLRDVGARIWTPKIKDRNGTFRGELKSVNKFT